MIHFISVLISPMTILFLLIVCSLLQELAIMNTLLRGSRRRKPRWLLMITITWFFIISTNPVPRLLAGYFENRYQVFDTTGFNNAGTTTYIVVPGAGYNNYPSVPATGNLSTTSLGRLTEAVRIHKMIPSSIIATFVGTTNDQPEDNVFAMAAVEMGVDTCNVITIGNVTNTWTEALEFRSKIGTGSEIIVVTDAIHMRRAVKFFSEFGFKSFAAPANFSYRQSPGHFPYGWMPSTNNINIMAAAMHEIGGLAYYNLLVARKSQY